MESYGSEAAPVFAGCFFLVYMLFILAITILVVVAHCKIFSKAGYHWALGLLMLVPIANLVMWLILAFGQWPIYRELEAYRSANQASPPTPQSPSPQQH